MAILIVGDGDLSFTKSVVKYVKNDCQFDIVSSCYESYDEIIEKYSQASCNIDYIRENGVSVLTNIDATNLSNYQFCFQFDLIIFNFPHIGGKSNIKNNRNLLGNFFRSVKESKILSEFGLICVSLCQGQAGTNIDTEHRIYNNSWQIEEMAAQSNYMLYDVRLFDLSPFGDYIPTGFRSQEKRFRLEGARVYVFKESHVEANIYENLVDKIELNRQMFWSPSWIRDYLEKGHNGEDIADKWVAYILGMLESEGFTTLQWDYVVDQCVDDGYVIFPVEESSDLTALQKTMCVFQDKCDLPHRRLCASPWVQVLKIISPNTDAGTRLACVTRGYCFYPCAQSPGRPMQQFLISIQQKEASDSEHNIDAYSTGLINEKDKKILSDGLIDLLNISQTTLVLPEVAAIGATISRLGRQYRVNIVNVSAVLEQTGQIGARNDWVNGDGCRDSLSILSAIFPVCYESRDRQRCPPGLVDSVDEIRLIGQRRHLDFHISRDMSFWWPSEDCSVDDLAHKISEICRSVFATHEDGPVTLVEDNFRHEESGMRSVCVRMPMKSGFVPLSRLTMNRLQSAVRLHCQQLLHVILR